MKRKKFNKKRFYRRLEAQGLVKGGLVIGGDFTPPWLMSCCDGFPNLAKAAGKAAEKFQEVMECIKKIDFQPPKITTVSTNLYGDGLILGRVEHFEICGSDLALDIRM
ncbi:hypothetical protein JWE36_18930 [Acinetobacter baumannii]|uniref:hypothetical protein n=1 Tax=Acinetobacter baumannii TaxID=470 RepID=UPI000F1EE916|nr:hypothetical protein [Acinetobacter baumannii]EKU5080903.1 hypothetical protein [Acinetobacter baumannii]EKU7178170.1 hypothetical protein [Acinetobacter baumannii]EKV3820583.1 hypothetical protein [Acinetobacter baumannii]EKV5282491.1 hypothetical protein [Acinetobacter baumannii]EKV9358029.1 hypothetical protein [Acinetobacter baumannii]